jgi:TRAP-type C4-dicarboxylate transport system substrate-binding protein
MNLYSFNALPPEHQEAILRAGREAGEYNRALSLRMDDENMDIVAAQPNVTLNIVEDLSEFQAAVQPVYEMFEEEFGDLIKLIQDTVRDMDI